MAQRRLSKLVEQKRIKRCVQTVPYSYYVLPQDNIITRINENWVRLWITHHLKSWERIDKWDYKTYIVVNNVTKAIKEYLISDINTPSIDKIREEFKCVK